MPDPLITSAVRGRRWLASPLALAVGIPLLIVLTGGGIAWIQHVAMERGIKQQAIATFRRMADDATRAAGDCLAQAGPILDGLAAWTDTAPDLFDDQALARDLLAFARGRAGVAYVHVADDRGNFRGVRLDGTQWRWVRTDRGVRGGTRRIVRTLGDDGTLGPIEIDAPDSYDPRTRPYWRVAAAAQGRAWTAPYAFASKPITGVSCAQPVLRGNGVPRLVLTVEFDLSTLGDALDRLVPDADGKVFLFSERHEMLALPRSWRPPEAAPGGRALVAADLVHPEPRAYFANKPLDLQGRALTTFPLEIDGVLHSGAVAALPVRGGPTWYLGLLIYRKTLAGWADDAQLRALGLGLGALGIGTLTGIWFALALARSRAEAKQQRARAHAAEQRAKELGSWHLIRRLGKGGMGEVWLAKHRLLARPAAVKLISPENLTGDDVHARNEARTRFTREAAALAGLRSRHTIELYDYGESADGVFYYVMELLDGLDLRDLVIKHGPLPAGRVVHLLRQACLSLAEAHDRHLVHRDIKPDNLFTSRRGDEVDVVKILDFGIVARLKVPTASTATAITRHGTVQGTPATMSPEQAMGLEVDGRSDLYSLGCVAYWLLTASDPFRSNDPYDLLHAHVHTPVQPPSQRLGRPIPPELERLVMDLLAKDPERRPADARIVRLRLDGVVLDDHERWTMEEAAVWWKEHLPYVEPEIRPGSVSGLPTGELAVDLRRTR